MRVEMDGINDLVAGFGADNLTAIRESRKAVERAVAGGVRDAKIFAPRDTGALANSIAGEVSYSAASTVGEFGPTVNYGAYVEEGTSRNAPQAYVGPAFDRNTPPFISAMEAIVGKLG